MDVAELFKDKSRKTLYKHPVAFLSELFDTAGSCSVSCRVMKMSAYWEIYSISGRDACVKIQTQPKFHDSFSQTKFQIPHVS